MKGQLKFSLQVNWQKNPKNCPFIKHAAGVVASVMHNNKKQHHPYDSKGASHVCARGMDTMHRCNWQTVRTLKNPQLVFYGLFVFL